MIGQVPLYRLFWKIPRAAGSKICIIEWTSSAKIPQYFSPLFLIFRATIGPVENHDTAAQIMIDPLPCLIVGWRQSRSYACDHMIRWCVPNVHPSCFTEKCERRFVTSYYFLPLTNRPVL
ncbi:hypothetical protein TNCV_1036621 [Trichonephila clavipes]|nr:hypothetical protein TNCV_1036621 [Trichonephila clavipes]